MIFTEDACQNEFVCLTVAHVIKNNFVKDT